jgi:hypothetical protein
MRGRASPGTKSHLLARPGARPSASWFKCRDRSTTVRKPVIPSSSNTSNAWLSCGARAPQRLRHRPPARRQLQPAVSAHIPAWHAPSVRATDHAPRGHTQRQADKTPTCPAQPQHQTTNLLFFFTVSSVPRVEDFVFLASKQSRVVLHPFDSVALTPRLTRGPDRRAACCSCKPRDGADRRVQPDVSQHDENHLGPFDKKRCGPALRSAGSVGGKTCRGYTSTGSDERPCPHGTGNRTGLQLAVPALVVAVLPR